MRRRRRRRNISGENSRDDSLVLVVSSNHGQSYQIIGTIMPTLSACSPDPTRSRTHLCRWWGIGRHPRAAPRCPARLEAQDSKAQI